MNKNLIGSIAGALIAVAITVWAVKINLPTVVAPDSPPTPAVVNTPDKAMAEIAAPSAVRVGELSVLDVSTSVADSFKWRVSPQTKNFLVIDGGRRAVFSAETPGEYLFFVSIARNGSVDSLIHTIKVGQGSTPKTTDIASKVAGWADQVKSPGKRDEALRLAQSFSSVAAMVTPSTPPADIVAMTVKSNRDALGGNLKAWEPFLVALQGELEARAANGTLSDANSHIAVWRSISAALNEYASKSQTTGARVRQ